MLAIIILLPLIGIAGTAPTAKFVPAGVHIPASVTVESLPYYGFSYSVSDPHTGDYKAQSEHNDGGVVRGSYSLAEPDGTLRVVEYTADPHSGFNAVVKRIGPALHPHDVRPVPIYTPIVASLPAALIGLGSQDFKH